MKRLLIQTQLSNVVNGKFDLSCDSGWAMTINRAREMLKLNPELHIDIMGPKSRQLIGQPKDLHPELFTSNRLRYVEHWVQPNALVTRFDFDWPMVGEYLGLKKHVEDLSLRYDAVYINDPCHLKNFKALFHVIAGYQPKFYVHSHFVDLPSCPKFPLEASLWYSQLEASVKADWNFWQCSSALREFELNALQTLNSKIVDKILAKSTASDDGYSIEEITSPIVKENLRFTQEQWDEKTRGKVVLFFPNRISPSSGDYTNGIKFFFELLPQLHARFNKSEFVVMAGNPNLKFSNTELEDRCGKHGYVKLHDFTLNRDEYKFVASNSDIVIGLYDKDAYGGTSSRECIELGCLPLWLNCNEYSSIAQQARCDKYVLADFSDIIDVAEIMINDVSVSDPQIPAIVKRLQKVIRQKCSYEQTVPDMMSKMDLL